ncbi:MAG: hypothetical protein HC812_10065 [Leptolyngbya sp. RL_3_1]|nr:hypothetical protein [Leptolyngbya sp. RL_3_1]
MSDTIGMMVGFLGGTIVTVETGYRVLQHPKPDKVFRRFADAKWFLAVRWCDQYDTPAGILTSTGQLSFHNQPAAQMGDDRFLPPLMRPSLFEQCLALPAGETATVILPEQRDQPHRQLLILAVEIDPRYGKVALVLEHPLHLA